MASDDQPSLLESKAIQSALVILVAVGILAAIYFLTHDINAMLIVAGGILVLVVLLLLYRGLVAWSRARKAGPMEKGIASNTGSAPNRIADPARRARLDDLRKSFETGVEKFRAAGKNLYSYPWYVMVGEAGSGKTEAVRRCGVGFPPGLQDQLQGAGGTINMNWWFTNHAIILDTAGRLMFEEVQPGSTNEWQEFLKLLKTGRPLCPINGMVLMIPADTLQTDTQDEIQKKAGKIAQQLDQIQRALGVRFPVFVVVTKCDLINGFNEFFNNLDDPNAQSQILGWSNPNPLDVAFSAEAVEQHLASVRERLLKHRMRLLLDPVNTEDPAARRLDQVDALYNLPDSLLKIGPRLKRYLETIFVAGEWSAKPLFLRGIYFTCAMQKGAALDLDLAQALGVPLNQLPSGPVWQRDRAYFLRDLFLKKVFPEKGLVTRAGNTRKQQRGRKLAVLLTGFAAVVTLGVLTWLGSRQLEENLGQYSYYYASLRKQEEIKPGSMALIAQRGGAWYRQDEDVDLRGKDVKAHEIRSLGEKLADESIGIPWIFKPIAGVLPGDVNADRRQVQRSRFDADVLVPLYSAARTRLSAETLFTWNASPKHSADARDALNELIRLEVQNSATGGTGKAGYDAKPDLDVLFRYVLSPGDYTTYLAQDKSAVDDSLKRLYGADRGGSQGGDKIADKTALWPPPALTAGSPVATGAVTQGVSTFLAAWQGQLSDSGEHMAAVVSARLAFNQFHLAFDDFKNIGPAKPDDLTDYTNLLRLWAPRLRRLYDAKGTVDSRLKKLDEVLGAGTSGKPLDAVYQEEVQALSGNFKSAVDAILKPIPEGVKDRPDASSKALAAVRDRLVNEGNARAQKFQDDALASVAQKEEWKGLRPFATPTTGLDGQQHKNYEVMTQAVLAANAEMPAAGDPSAASATGPAAPASPVAAAVSVSDVWGPTDKGVREAAQRVNGRLDDVAKRVDNLAVQDGTTAGLREAVAVARFGLDAAGRAQRYYAFHNLLLDCPGTPERWADRVARLHEGLEASEKQRIDQRPAVALTSVGADPAITFEPKYSPSAAGPLVRDWRSFAAALSDETKSSARADDKVLERNKLRAAYEDKLPPFTGYVEQYQTYWRRDALALKVEVYAFADYLTRMRGLRGKIVNDALEALGKKAIYALDQVKDDAGAKEVKEAIDARNKQGFEGVCEELLTNWAGLSNDPAVARDQILAKRPSEIINRFVLLPEAGGGFVRKYWSDLGVAVLQALGNQSQKLAGDQIRRLVGNEFRKFPLAPPGPGGELSAEKFREARTLISSVWAPRDARGGSPDAPVRDGGITTDSAVNNILARVRAEPGEADFKILDAMKQRLPGLPAPGAESLNCTISVVKEDGTIGDFLQWGAIRQMEPADYRPNQQADEKIAVGLRGSPKIEPITTVQYPGKPVLLLLFESTKDGVKVWTPLPSPEWAALQLLYSGKSQPIAGDGNADDKLWQVETSVKDAGGAARKLILQLKFDRDMKGFLDAKRP